MKKNVFLLSLIALISIVVVNCTKKELPEKGNVESNEIRQIIQGGSTPFNITGITLSNGMLIFDSENKLTELEEVIEDFNDEWGADSNTIASADTG